MNDINMQYKYFLKLEYYYQQYNHQIETRNFGSVMRSMF